MHALIHRRILLPFALVAILATISYSSLPDLHRLQLGKLRTTNGVSTQAAAAAAQSAEQSADMVYPLFDYTYDKIFKLSAERKSSKDPCIDVALPGGGSIAKLGEGIRVLVTGGAGFIGSNLVDRLLQLGYRVRIFDNLYTGFIRNVPLDHPDIEYILGNILDENVLSEAVEGMDFVDGSVLHRIQCSGSWNVLEAVRKAGEIQKVIYAASSTYYGNNPTPHKEDMAPDFLTPYAASKYEGELQMQMFDRLFGVPTISTRFFMVYGPRQPSTGAYAIVTGVFAKQASEGKPLTIEGDGSHYRDFIQVLDVVEGLIFSQQNTDLRGDVVNLGSGSAFSVQDVADLVSSNQLHVDTRSNDLKGTLADTCKMRRLLGYKTRRDFKAEMASMAKETMEGNVFMQPWLTSAHALSAPHLLAPGSPTFGWPTETSDLDALLLAIKHVEEKVLIEGESVSRRISVIMFATVGEDISQISDLLLNTVFSMVRFGGVKSYMIAAKDDGALSACLSLNLPCYDSRTMDAPTLLFHLISRSYGVHVAQLGNSYVSGVDAALAKHFAENSNVNVVGANPSGDVYVRPNDRTKAALDLWSRSEMPITTNKDSMQTISAIDKWPALDLTKATFSTGYYCNASWVGEAASAVAEQTASTSGHFSAATLLQREHQSSSLSRYSSHSSPPRGFSCTIGFNVAVGCASVAQSENTNATIEALQSVGAWHLSQCQDKEHCDRQQVAPLRWMVHPPDLAPFGGMC